MSKIEIDSEPESESESDSDSERASRSEADGGTGVTATPPAASGVTRPRMVECNGFCGDRVPESETVDVVAGAVVGEWTDPVPHIGIRGINAQRATTEQWCTGCSASVFGIESPAERYRDSLGKRYLTPRVIAALMAGLFLGLVVSIMFVM